MLVARTRDTDRHHLLKQRAADRRVLEMQQVGLDFQFVEHRLDVEAAQRRRLDPIRQGDERQRLFVRKRLRHAAEYAAAAAQTNRRSEEHTSELQSLMRISYAVFCL